MVWSQDQGTTNLYVMYVRINWAQDKTVYKTALEII